MQSDFITSEMLTIAQRAHDAALKKFPGSETTSKETQAFEVQRALKEAGHALTVDEVDELIALAVTPDAADRVSTSFPLAAAAQVHTPPALAHDQRILDRLSNALAVCGVVGEDRNAKIIYLALTSRFLDEPVSVAIKGASSSGKSYTVEAVMKFVPPAAYLAMTAMSERALIYMKEDFEHRTIILFEAVALREQREKAESNMTAYLIRSLLSEGRLNYPVTVRDKDGGWITKTIVKNGPTNLIVTTTAVSLHPENETRMLSLPTNDTQGQTRAVLLQLANGKTGAVDEDEWHALQLWLAAANHRVAIPYARYLAETIPPVAVRLRRDFKTILRLIETHAILHQLNREEDEQGRIIAREDDYLAIRELVADLVADGVGATVSATMRETVDAATGLADEHGASVQVVAAMLKLDRSAAQRRLKAARERGYLINLEDRRGRPARYAMGDPLPGQRDLLPAQCTSATDESADEPGVCSSAVAAEDEERGDGRPGIGENGSQGNRLADLFTLTDDARARLSRKVL